MVRGGQSSGFFRREASYEQLKRLGEYRVAEILLYGALVYATLTVARFAWFFIVSNLNAVFDRLLRSRYLRSLWQEHLLLS